MEPLKPTQKQSILENSPNAAPADLEEYERLLSTRFTMDPDFASAKAPSSGETAEHLSLLQQGEERIAQLHSKLFGSSVKPSPGVEKVSR
jgi:hypothetical protein